MWTLFVIFDGVKFEVMRYLEARKGAIRARGNSRGLYHHRYIINDGNGPVSLLYYYMGENIYVYFLWYFFNVIWISPNYNTCETSGYMSCRFETIYFILRMVHKSTIEIIIKREIALTWSVFDVL